MSRKKSSRTSAHRFVAALTGRPMREIDERERVIRFAEMLRQQAPLPAREVQPPPEPPAPPRPKSFEPGRLITDEES